MWASCPASCLLSGCTSSQQHKANSSVNLRKNPFLCFPSRSVQYPSYNDCKNSEVSSSESIGGSIEFRFCNSRHHTKVSCARLWLQISAPCFNKATTDLTTVSKCCPCWLAWSVIPCTQVACFEIVSPSGDLITTETFSVVRQKYYRASTELFIDDIWRQGKLYWHGIIANVRTLHLSSTSSQTPTLPRARLDGGSHTSLTIPKAALQVTFLFKHVSYPHFQRQMRPLGI